MKEVTFKGNDNDDNFVVAAEQTYPLGVAVVVTEDDAKALDGLDGFSIKDASQGPGPKPSPPSSNSKN
jgi:hypothetical protein